MEEKILQAIKDLNSRFDSLENRFDSLENRFDSLEDKFDSLENRFDSLGNRFDYLKSQVKENTEILKALEHSAQVNKAEHEQMAINIAEISGEVKKINKKLAALELVTANNWSDIVHLKAIK